MNRVSTAGFHRVFVALSSSLTAIAALWAATDSSALGIDQQTAAYVALGLAVANVVATAVRQAWEQP